MAALAVGLPMVRASREPRDLTFGQREPDDLGGEELRDESDDARLRLPVGERTRRRLGHTHDPVVGAHPHQHVVGGVDLPRGELQRFDVWDGERNRLDGSDFHSNSSTRVLGESH